MAYLSADGPHWSPFCRQMNYALQSVTSTFQSFFYEEKEVDVQHGKRGWPWGGNLPSKNMGIEGGAPLINISHSIKPGQIIATSHDLTPNGGLVKEIP